MVYLWQTELGDDFFMQRSVSLIHDVSQIFVSLPECQRACAAIVFSWRKSHHGFAMRPLLPLDLDVSVVGWLPLLNVLTLIWPRSAPAGIVTVVGNVS